MSGPIRQAFEEQLAALQQDVVRMGGLASQAVEVAVRIVVERNPDLRRQVMEIENQIDALNLDIECRAIQLLARQQPMARDLRTIIAMLRIIADIERIGDYAVDTARQTEELARQSLFKPLVDIPRMAQLVQSMLHDSLEGLVHRDLELAMKAVLQDDEVDYAYRSLHDELIEFFERDPSLTSQAIALLLIGTYLERMADHVTNIGERIWYMETGEIKELHE
ncbi:MAG: phosphate signaling complex protein PhoU [Armatimonadota bacterium]|nr:MAG: phosphate signaling complex protein PhoU [Armatimonadota bacterium]